MSKPTLVVDSTQITQFLTCPQSWVLGFVEGIEKNDLPPARMRDMGTFGHLLLERYYKFRTNEILSRHAYEHTLDIMQPEDWKLLKEEDKNLVCKRFEEYLQVYSIKGDIRPVDLDSVEIGFTETIYEDDTILLVLEGKIDVIARREDGQYIVDHKFQGARNNLYKKSVQFRNYTMVADLGMLAINYIRLTKNIDQFTFERQFCLFSPLERAWWKKEITGIMRSMLFIRESLESTQEIPKNYSSCQGKFGSHCQYTNICEHTDQTLIKNIKTFEYKPKEIWRPW